MYQPFKTLSNLDLSARVVLLSVCIYLICLLTKVVSPPTVRCCWYPVLQPTKRGTLKPTWASIVWHSHSWRRTYFKEYVEEKWTNKQISEGNSICNSSISMSLRMMFWPRFLVPQILNAIPKTVEAWSSSPVGAHWTVESSWSVRNLRQGKRFKMLTQKCKWSTDLLKGQGCGNTPQIAPPQHRRSHLEG